ncbi:O-methyltransferase [Pyrodictium occultum]|uniref:O-methyltransferase n=1 Tax=Pyrodictium occultum TaxID=2309 RepID=UPI001F194F09|nr:class I SAM-dependent methyltransferase [Pyrodictium occultum]
MGPSARLLELLERVEEESARAGIPSIEREDGSALYAVAYLYTLGRGGEGVAAADLGAGIGYSTLWLAGGVEAACTRGCRVVAVEADPWRSRRLREVLGEAGLERTRLEAVQGDALSYLERLGPGSLDIVFVDVDKHEYARVLELLESRLRPGGVAVFHNAYFPRPPGSFFEAVERGPWRSTVVPTRLGLLVAVRA